MNKQEIYQQALDKNIRDPRKLYQYVRSQGVETTVKEAAAALRGSTQRELLAPQVRYQGHFAANAPGDQIQADLIDWGSGNTKAKKGGGQFAVVATDVYTRKTEAVPIANKKASTVEAATADGYTALNASLAWRPIADTPVTLSLRGRNLTNAEIREHASFLKDIAPSPARSVSASLSWTF